MELGSADFALVSKVMGERWSALSEEARAPYIERQQELSQQFYNAKAAYEEYAKLHMCKRRCTIKAVKRRVKVKASTTTTAQIRPLRDSHRAADGPGGEATVVPEGVLEQWLDTLPMEDIEPQSTGVEAETDTRVEAAADAPTEGGNR